jgi:hypothetical protein
VSERAAAAFFSFVAAWLFLAEYLPPLLRRHLIWDFEGYHYPLLNYAFRSLSEGRFPQWDPGIYCGISFAGNIQASIFYPPTWLLFAANWGRPAISFASMHVFVAMHFWVALFCAYLWLRNRRLRWEAAACGAAAFAFSGVITNELQHLGATCAAAWLPLALLGIDEASSRRDWRPLWKVAAASSLAFLAGFPFTWVALCLCAVLYALALPGRRWLSFAVAAALAVSLLMSMVQVLPAAEAASMKVPARSLGGGLPGMRDYFTLLAPNYFDQAMHVPAATDENCFYLGVTALFGACWLAWRRSLRAAVPALVVAGGAHLIMADPFRVVTKALEWAPPLNQMVREYCLLLCLPAAAAFIAGEALHEFLERPAASARRGLAILALAIGLGVTGFRLAAWVLDKTFLVGWTAIAETLVAMGCLALILSALRSESRPRWRVALLSVLLTFVWTDAKVHGTSRRYNAARDSLDTLYAKDVRLGGSEWEGMDHRDYLKMLSASFYRVAVEQVGVQANLRHYRLSTPQGFDPLLPVRYRDAIRDHVNFQSNRIFMMDPERVEMFGRLGVKHIIADRNGPLYNRLLKHDRFRILADSDSYYAVFEYLDARPIYRFDAGTARPVAWSAERRTFKVTSQQGGRFVMIEQFYPGWRALVDGQPVPIEPHWDTFQRISVPAGGHMVSFEYRARGLRTGALISLLACIGLWLTVRRRRASQG